jgi:hypothetical protein
MGQAITSTQFLQKCATVKKVNRVSVREEETVYTTLCLGYYIGFVDHYELLDNENNMQNKTSCLTVYEERLTNTLLVEIVFHYLYKNPAMQNQF